MKIKKYTSNEKTYIVFTVRDALPEFIVDMTGQKYEEINYTLEITEWEWSFDRWSPFGRELAEMTETNMTKRDALFVLKLFQIDSVAGNTISRFLKEYVR